jgi:arabinogalactan oligomer / maltooligosaccharide transport system permease protein
MSLTSGESAPSAVVPGKGTDLSRPATANASIKINPRTGQPRLPIGRWWREVGWRHVVGLIAVVWAVIPVLYIISAALNPLGSIVSTNLIPTSISFENFHKILTDPNTPYPQWMLNSLIVCLVVTAVQVFFSALAAYAFSRFRFRGRRGGLLTLLLIQMFPQFLAAVAIFDLFSTIGDVVPKLGLNTLLGYMLVLLGGSLGQVWLIKGFFDSIPRDLDEAATVDGAGHATIFFKIILPLVRPIMAVTGLLVFVSVIGEFLLASIFLRDNAVKTVAVGLTGLLQAKKDANLGVFAAGALLTAIPVVLLFQFLQRFIVGGITAGSVKG